MNYQPHYYSSKLKETLLEKQRINSRYSLRAFARDLGMHPSTLTLVIQRKKPLPKKNVDYVIKKLEMSLSEESIFRDSLDKTKKTFLEKTAVSIE